jgi:hypothetical protein
MMPMRAGRVVVAALVSLFCLALAIDFAYRRFAFPNWLVPLRDEYRARLAALKVNDGVDASEAEQIADLYMLEYVSGCGAPMPPQLRDGTWTSPLRLGVAGQLSDRVVKIDAKTGAVYSPGGPAFGSFPAFAEDLVDGVAARRR